MTFLFYLSIGKMPTNPPIPIVTLPLFPELDRLLLELLRGLPPADWQRPTLARQWSVKDIVAHLLDGVPPARHLLEHVGEVFRAHDRGAERVP